MSSSRPDSLADPFLTAPNTPLSIGQSLEPPRASYLSPTPQSAASPRDSYADSPDNASPLVPESEKRDAIAYTQELRAEPAPRRRSILARPLFWLIAFGVVAVIVPAVVVPVYFVVIKPHNDSTTSGASAGGAPAPSSTPSSPPGVTTTGGNGSVITTADGTTFTYLNPFGGICKRYHPFAVAVELLAAIWGAPFSVPSAKCIVRSSRVHVMSTPESCHLLVYYPLTRQFDLTPSLQGWPTQTTLSTTALIPTRGPLLSTLPGPGE